MVVFTYLQEPSVENPLTEEERKAKDSVVLPYTHHLHQQKQEMITDEDGELDDLDDDLDI